MVIKNKSTLVRRAAEHKELDHVTRKNYGKIRYSTNGETEVQSWQGCAISCLATESSIGAIKEQGKLISGALKIDEEDGRTFWSVELPPQQLRNILSIEFGLCDNLIYLAEIIFEGNNVSNEYAQDWPLRFAEAVPEGVNITDEDVERFWNEFDVQDYDGSSVELDVQVEDYEKGWTNIDEYFDYVNEELGDDLIAWLESLAI